mmetsp:Transcript_32101/g.74684  ORF Transcript_32101/g.74684 Transcript_32101/m.74684 type:complete len:122 (+) Transcript_32101:591-956(+)
MESQQATAAATVNDTPAAGALDPMPKMLSPGGEAPRCSCVVLKEDGETESRTVPIVPNWERKELGGPPSIIGFYPGLNAIVLGVDIISINDMKVTHRAVVGLEAVFLLCVCVCVCECVPEC